MIRKLCALDDSGERTLEISFLEPGAEGRIAGALGRMLTELHLVDVEQAISLGAPVGAFEPAARLVRAREAAPRLAELLPAETYRDYLALAYSNRAVLHWMSNDTAAAQSDLKKAAAAAPKATFVARNLTALQSHTTVAQVAVAPKS